MNVICIRILYIYNSINVSRPVLALIILLKVIIKMTSYFLGEGLTHANQPTYSVSPLMIERVPSDLYFTIRGLRLHTMFWPGEGDPLVLLHATGFHAHCWDEIIQYLPDRPVYAVDIPCHGGSEAVYPPPDWDEASEMVTELVRQLDLRQVIAVGHSFGGHILTQVAAAESQRFLGLLLLDPVIPHPEVLPVWQAMGSLGSVSRRRNVWASPEEMEEAFRHRIPYNTWDAAVLRDYCRYGLIKDEDVGQFRLACPPDCEASFYSGRGAQKVYENLPLVKMPVRILRARGWRSDDQLNDFRPSPTWPDLAAHMPNAEDIQFTELDHFFPMSQPRLVMEHLVEVMRVWG